jgi:uncharacterized membrane protein
MSAPMAAGGRQEAAGDAPQGADTAPQAAKALEDAVPAASGAKALRAASALVALIGLGIATYLTIVHYAGGSPVCAIAHGCEVVQKSDYASVAGIPVAVLGLAGYVAILASLTRDGENARTATAFLALAGLGFSAWLTYVEVGVLNAICIWCVGSAICMAVLAALSVTRLLRSA